MTSVETQRPRLLLKVFGRKLDEAGNNTDISTGGQGVFQLLFWGLVLLYCAWVLTLPLFPSQDGPIHLYYTWVLSHLFSGSEFFSQYFSFRHPIPPYIVHYLLLFFLMKVFSPLVAEKIVVCLIIAGFALSFRFLIRTVSPTNGAALAILAIPLSLSWPLGMGFHNYCLSLALSFWSVALWFRAAASDRNSYRVVFLLSCLVMLFTHPIPLMMTLVTISGEITLRAGLLFLARGRTLRGVLSEAPLRRDLIVALIAFSSVAYIAIFVSGGRTAENLHHKLIQGRMLLDFVKAKPLILVFGNIWARLYRIFLFAVLACSFLVTLWSLKTRWTRAGARALERADVLSIIAACIFVFYPLIPRSINGSDFFADRLVIYLWMFAIAGAAASVHLRPRQLRLCGIVAATVAVVVLAYSDGQFRSTAHQLAKLETPRVLPPGHRGVFIDAPYEPSSFFLNFNPYLWSSARYFRVTDSVMLNAPFLDQNHLPLAPAKKLFTNLFPAKIIDYPDLFPELLLKSQRARDLVDRDLDFIIFIGYSGKDPNATDNVLKRHWSRSWGCQRDGWYAICSSTGSHSDLARNLIPR